MTTGSSLAGSRIAHGVRRVALALLLGALTAAVVRTPPPPARPAALGVGPSPALVTPADSFSPELSELIEQVRADTMSTSVFFPYIPVGPTFGPRFPLLETSVRLRGTVPEFLLLAEDRSSIARAMGLVALAIEAPRDVAWDALHRHRCDPGPFQLCGGVRAACNVGYFALDLLAAEKPFGHPPHDGGGALLDAAEIERERWLIATDPSCPAGDFADALPPSLRERHRDLLEQPPPGIARWQVIWLLGRLGPRYRDNQLESLQTLMLDILAERPANPIDQLAAASALARHTDQRGVLALSSLRDQLDALAPERWGTRLLELAVYRRRQQRQLETASDGHGYCSWFTGDWARSVLAINAPFGIGYALSRRCDIVDTPAVCAGRRDLLLQLAPHLRHHVQPWDTYSDLPHDLLRTVRSPHRNFARCLDPLAIASLRRAACDALKTARAHPDTPEWALPGDCPAP